MSAYGAIADPTRRQILDLLSEGEIPAGELASHFSVSRPAVSRHLRVLRGARLVRETRRGRHRFYALNAGPLREVDSWVRRYERFWRESMDAFKRYLEDEREDQADRSSPGDGKE
jgi:DNA-binding transcriptional ArsR family regulator